MSVILMEGFDRYSPFIRNDSGGWSISLSAGRSGGSCLTGNRTSTSSYEFEHYGMLSAPVSQGCFGVAFRVQSSTISNVTRFCVREGSTYHFFLRVMSGYLTLYSGTGAVLATGVTPIAYNQWFHLGCEFVIADSGGRITAFLNGVQELSYTGDTRNGGTGLADRFVLTTAGTQISANDQYWYMDDVYVLDEPVFPGDLLVETLNPVGNGAASEWVGSDGNSVDNWALVDDTSAADYVGTQTAGAQDLYAMADGSAAYGDVIAVQSAITGFKATAGGTPAGGLVITHRSEGGVELQSDILLSAAQQTSAAVWRQSPILNVDPNGDPWTLSRLNALQVGPKLVS